MRVVAPIPDRLLDFLEIAATVFAADGAVRRGGDTRPGFGEGWRRTFDFSIAVRDPEFWNRIHVIQALRETVSFLTEDDAFFSFTRSQAPTGSERYFDLAEPGDPDFAVESVLLFSGGLDSLTGAVETLDETTGRVALVTHLSAPKRMSHQTDLVEALQRLYPDRILWLPVLARRKGGKRSREMTQRSRSLLFAALGVVAARMLGARHLRFFENGVTSHNLPISSQIVGTMATRTTHPQSLRLLDGLAALVSDRRVSIENPYQWMTKTEVLTRLAELGGRNLIARSVSCSAVWKRSRDEPHCGSCSQCIDRRFAMIATGLADDDPSAGYGTDVMVGRRETEQSRILALDWVRHAVGFESIDPKAFMGRFGSELMRIVKGLSPSAATEAATRTIDMHRRHAVSVRQALAVSIQNHSKDLAHQRLPATSLIRMFLGETELGDVLKVTNRTDATASVDAKDHRRSGTDILPLQVALEGDPRDARVELLGLGALSVMPARLVAALKPDHDKDRDDKLTRDKCRFTPAAEISVRVGETAPWVRQGIRRGREELAEYYTVIFDNEPAAPLLFESRPREGYRLDPDCRFVVPESQ